MGRKLKFKPVITRVKLNPEQAVLSCNCFTTGASITGSALWNTTPLANHCYGAGKLFQPLNGCNPSGTMATYPNWTPGTASS